jgi:hypothetical protein
MPEQQRAAKVPRAERSQIIIDNPPLHTHVLEKAIERSVPDCPSEGIPEVFHNAQPVNLHIPDVPTRTFLSEMVVYRYPQAGPRDNRADQCALAFCRLAQVFHGVCSHAFQHHPREKIVEHRDEKDLKLASLLLRNSAPLVFDAFPGYVCCEEVVRDQLTNQIRALLAVRFPLNVLPGLDVHDSI